MCKVASTGEIKAHDAVMRVEQGRVDGKVRRAAGAGCHLHIK